MRAERIYIALLILVILPVSLAGQKNDLYRIEKVPVSLNMFSEIAPYITDEGILFCSDRKFSIIKDTKNYNEENIYNIFFAERKDTMSWGTPRIYSRDLRSDFFDGPFCFTPDGKQIYYTRNIETGKRAMKRRSGSPNNYGIFIADRSGEGWTNIRPFEYNDPLWKTAHPQISPDGKYLFFASDMPGGEGKSDLYMCEWVDGKWTKPVNLGPEVNSPEADLYPYFNRQQELYFASDRPGGSGKLDIYTSRLDFGSWSKPVALPEPLNSSDNDFALVNDDDATGGFFSSDRGRTDDIYKFTSMIIRKTGCGSMTYDSYCFEFYEEYAVRFDSMPFSYEWDFGDGTKAMGVRTEHCFEGPGIYFVKMNVIDEITGEIKYEESSDVVTVIKSVQAFFSSPDTVLAGESVPFDAALTNLPGWDIAEYYWNFDDGTIARGEKVEKSFAEPGSYQVQLIISSKPDGSGAKQETCSSKTINVRRRQ